MKRITSKTIMALVACAAVLALVANAASEDKPKTKHHPKTPIIALAPDGSTWIAGEAKFSAVEGILEVSIDMACGVPNTPVYITTYIGGIGAIPVNPSGFSDDRGDVKCVEYREVDMPETIAVYIKITVKGTDVQFFTSESDPAVVEPK